MKTQLAKILPVLTLSALFACVPNNQPLRLKQVYPLKAATGTSSACTSDTTIQLVRGTLDIALGASYWGSIAVSSELATITQKGQTGNLQSGEGNIAYVNQVDIEYTVNPPQLALPKESIAISAVIPPETTDNEIRLPFIGPQARALLGASVMAGDPAIEVTAKIQIKAALASGPIVVSNTLTYPIEVYKSSDTGCTSTQRAALNGPCGNVGGQDGAAATCCPLTVDPMDTSVPEACK